MKRLLVSAVLALSLCGCGATSALNAVSAVTGGKPDVTAQVGKENVKQGLGVNSKVEETTSIQDVQGSVNASKQGQQVQAGHVQAETVKVSNGAPVPMLVAFGIGMASVLGLVFWFVPSPLGRRDNNAK